MALVQAVLTLSNPIRNDKILREERRRFYEPETVGCFGLVLLLRAKTVARIFGLAVAAVGMVDAGDGVPSRRSGRLVQAALGHAPHHEVHDR